jgi:hypothetical protein
MSAIGMRPVPTWKSTDAAPTPMSEGAIAPPSALSPWQEEQPFRKICLPSSMAADRENVFGVDLIVALATLNVVPIPSSAIINSNGAAAR